jgi:hypothetical protein
MTILDYNENIEFQVTSYTTRSCMAPGVMSLFECILFVNAELSDRRNSS